MNLGKHREDVGADLGIIREEEVEVDLAKHWQEVEEDLLKDGKEVRVALLKC